MPRTVKWIVSSPRSQNQARPSISNIRFYDVSAALNISRIAAGPGRPRELSSWTGRPRMPNPGGVARSGWTCATMASCGSCSGGTSGSDSRVDAPSLALQPQRGLLLADVNLSASLVKKPADGLAQRCQRPDTKASLSPQQLELLSQALHVPVAPLQTLLQSCPELHHVSGAQLSAAISKVATELQLPLSDARALAARQPVMVLQAQPGELATATAMLAQHLALPFCKVATAAVSIPSILKRDPAVVQARLSAMATVLGSLPMHVMLRMAAAAPEYLTARPAALSQRLALYSRLLGRPTHMLLGALQQQPDLVFLGPRVLLNKVKVLQSVLNKPMRQVLPLVLACPELMRADMDQVRQAQEVLAKQVSKSSGHAYAMVCHCPRLLLQPPAQLLARTRSLQQACQACGSWAVQWGRLSPAQVADCLACTRATYSRLQLLTHCGRAAELPLHQALTMRKAAFLKLLVQALPAPAPGSVLKPDPGPDLNTAALPPPAPAPRNTTAPDPDPPPAALLATAAPSPWCPDPAYPAPPLRPGRRAGGSGTAGQGGQPLSELPPPLSAAVSCLPPWPGATQARPAQQQAPPPATWLPAAAGAGSSPDLAQPMTPQHPTPPHASRLPAAGGVPPQGWQLQLHHAHQPSTQPGTSAGPVGGLQLQGQGQGAGAGPGVGGEAQAGLEMRAGPEAGRTLGAPTQGWVGVRQRRERHRRSRAQAGQWAGQVGRWEPAPGGGSNQQQEQGTGVGGQCVTQPSMGERAWLSQQWAGPGREEGGSGGCAGGLQSRTGLAQLQGQELQELAQLSGQQGGPGQLQQLAPVAQQERERPRPASSLMLHTVQGPDQPAGAARAQAASTGAAQAQARAAEGAGAGPGGRQRGYLSVWNSHSCSGHSPLNGVRDRQGSSGPGGRAASSAASSSSSDGGGDSAWLQQAGRGSLVTCRSDVAQAPGGHTADSTLGGARFMANGTHSSVTSTFTTRPDLSARSSGGTSSGGSSSMGGGARSSWPRLCLTYRRHSKQRPPRHLRPRNSRAGRRKPLAAPPLPPPSPQARRQPPPSPTPATPISAGRTAISAAAGRALGASMRREQHQEQCQGQQGRAGSPVRGLTAYWSFYRREAAGGVHY
ncbi:hypothetical protein QJQ45_022295 [Haematococcus lacustris]|nr:hypothetical protein QJQ45_022295 [Haematococcus lacustris]